MFNLIKTIEMPGTA